MGIKIILPGLLPEDFSGGPIFFLMGPVLGGGNWQAAMCKFLKKRMTQDFNVAVPCKWDKAHEFSPFFNHGGVVSHSQLQWERVLLEEASRNGCITCFLPEQSLTEPRNDGNPYARDTYGEIGEWRGRIMSDNSIRLVIGADRDFPGLRVIRNNFHLALGTPFPFYETLEETADAAVARWKQ